MKDWPPSPARIEEVFNARASNYDESRMHRWLARRAVDQARLAPGMTILDLAAGTGLAIREAADRLNGQGQFIAVDIAADMLAVAEGAAKGRFPLRLIQADVSHVPLPAHTADVALCVSSIAYVDEPTEALREWKRLLKPVGQLVFQTFAAGTMVAPALFREAVAELGILLSDPNAAMGTPDRCAEALRSAGFQLESLVEDVWRESLPEADRFWTAMADGVLADVIARMPSALAASLRERFSDKIAARRKQSGEEEYRALLVCARAV